MLVFTLRIIPFILFTLNKKHYNFPIEDWYRAVDIYEDSITEIVAKFKLGLSKCLVPCKTGIFNVDQFYYQKMVRKNLHAIMVIKYFISV